MIRFLVSILFYYSGFIHSSYSLKCDLPESCRLEEVYDLYANIYTEKGFDKYTTIMCDIKDNSFEFKFKEPAPVNLTNECDNYKNPNIFLSIIFRWASNELNIFDKRLNFSNLYRYTGYFMNIFLWDVKGFDVNIFDDSNLYENSTKIIVRISNGRLEFYHNKKKITSCQDLIDFNISRVQSIFQIRTETYISIFQLRNVEYKGKICPLLFNNTNIYKLDLFDLVDTFYKKNILLFFNELFPGLNSDIKYVDLLKCHNINLDLNFFHPSVFNNTLSLSLASGSLNSIDGIIFKHLNKFICLSIDQNDFRKLNNKQGIDWIRQMNFGLNVNISNIPKDTKTPIEVVLGGNVKRITSGKIFPDEDFCIYVDFPFNQLVIVYRSDEDEESIEKEELSCTYLWLAQYYKHLYKLLRNSINRKIYYLGALKLVLNSKSFKTISNCNFETRIRLCNKSNYQTKNIWIENDFFILNKILQFVFKISLYPISFLGLITNFIVLLVILYKENSDLFKEYKQYSYLWLNSAFCLLILMIEILSWMTECFFPFEVFCPEIRKLVAIQFFKIIFKECLVTMLRFMCNFTYLAFALNRISLIGKDHGKLVTFMSELGVKKYIGVALFISISLSWIKGFKYEINYFYPASSFPMSNEMDLMNIINFIVRPFNDFYFTFSLISDLVNYFVFVIICVIIDICMVVQLRRTLNEKSIKNALMNQRQNQNKAAENEEAVNKAIKMVVLNSAIGVFFKLPVCFIPVLNVYAEFYFRTNNYKFYHPSFSIFYSMLFNTGFYVLIQDMSYFFFTLSLSIQVFIYNRFDKKFRTGYERLKDKAFLKIKNRFKSSI